MTTANGHRKVLVTGGAGFIGSHIVAGLTATGWQAEVLDNLSTGSERNVPAATLIRRIDIRSAGDVGQLFGSVHYDAVVHCAAQTSVERSMKDPDLDREINVIGTRTLIEGAREGGVSRFVYLSSGGAIYGESAEPATEATMPSPRSFYGLHKYVAEEFVRTAGLGYAILRPSNVYGPRQRTDVEGGVIAIFTERMLGDQPIVVYGDGSQVRDFVHVDDVVAAVTAGLGVSESGVWNVASGVGTTVLDLVSILSRVLGRTADPVYAPPRAGDIQTSRLSCESLSSTRLWGPPLTLQQGLERMQAELRESTRA